MTNSPTIHQCERTVSLKSESLKIMIKYQIIFSKKTTKEYKKNASSRLGIHYIIESSKITKCPKNNSIEKCSQNNNSIK